MNEKLLTCDDVILTKNFIVLLFFSSRTHVAATVLGRHVWKLSLSRGDYKFGGGKLWPTRRYWTTCMNIPWRSTLRSQFRLATFKRGCSLGEIHLARRSFYPHFFSLSLFFKSPSLIQCSNPLFAWSARWCLLSSSIIAEIPAETRA